MTTRFRILGLLALGALVFGSARAQVSVQANVTNNGPAYHYEYTVNNQTGSDLSSVTLAGLPAAQWLWRDHKDDVALLITDAMMPGRINGVQLGEQLSAERLGLRVIYCSGYSRDLVASNYQLAPGGLSGETVPCGRTARTRAAFARPAVGRIPRRGGASD